TLHGNKGCLPQSAQRSRGAPKLDLRYDANPLAYLQQGAVPFGSPKQVEVGLVRRSCGRSRYTLAANLLHQLHGAAGLFQSLLAALLVVHNPFEKRDGTRDAQAAVANPLAQDLEVAAIFYMRFQLPHPGLDGLVA